MDYIEARRKDRLLAKEQSLELLVRGEYGFLSVSDGGCGYGIPLNFALEGDRVYFHCAPEGRKLDTIAENPMVSFCVVGHTRPIPEQFSTIYESVIVQGRISVCDDDAERLRGLTLLSDKYCPGLEELAQKYIAASKPRTAVLRLDIEKISGKAKKAKP